MDHAYAKKRRGWALVLNGAALEHGMSHQAIQALITWAVAAPGWEIDGEEWTWTRVLDVTDPAGKLASKLPTVVKSRERGSSSARRDKVRSLHVYAPGPGAPNRYYDGDEEITCDEWRRRGGRFAEDVDEARRAARL